MAILYKGLVYVFIVVYDVFPYLVFQTEKMNIYYSPHTLFSKHLNKREFPLPPPLKALILSTFLMLQTSVHIVRFSKPYRPRERENHLVIFAFESIEASFNIIFHSNVLQLLHLVNCKAQITIQAFATIGYAI